MQFMTYQEALDAGVVTQFVSGQLATADTINGNEKASYDNDVALKSLMDNAIVTINSTISSLIDGSPTDADTLKKLNDKILAINIILTSNDFSLDTIQEVVNFIKNDATYIANLQLNKIDISAIVDNLLSINGSVPLSANQGQVLKALIDAMYTNTQIDNLLLGKSNSNHIHDLASQIVSGFMSATDKAKLDDIQAGATNFKLPSSFPASMITQDSSNMFASVIEKARWNDTYTTEQIDAKAVTLQDGASIYTTFGKVETKFNLLDVLLGSNNVNIDTVQEIVNLITSEQTTIDSLVTSKVSISSIVNNLTSSSTVVPLSANQGQVLKALIDAMYTNNQIDTALSGKVSTVSGKSLSTNDFTNTYKGQLDNLNNSLILISSVTQGVSFTAVGNTAYILVVAGITVTLPTTPTTGMVVELMDGTGALNAITVTAGGTVLVDGLSSYTIDAPKFDYRFVYVNPTYGWKVFGF